MPFSSAPPRIPVTQRLKIRAADTAAGVLALLLRPWGRNTYRNLVNALWERQPASSSSKFRLCIPEHVSPDPSERPLVERIFASYGLAKQAQARPENSRYLPGGGWKNVTNSAFAPLQEGFQHNDLERFHYFLSNFGAWEQPTGINESWTFAKLQRSPRKRVFFEQHTMARLIQWWQDFESQGRPLSVLTLPPVGNFGGVLVDEHRILPNSVYSDYYSQILKRFLNTPRPIVAELGGGFGRLCYFLKQQLPNSVYVGLDLPECLACASYFLLRSFPGKRFQLFGEGELSSASLQQYDFVLRPSFEISCLADRSIDLFLNENSLGMVPPAACRKYVEEICRTSQAFWHRNHEVFRNTFEDGSVSLVNGEYPVDGTRFQLLVRDCDIARLVGHDHPSEEQDLYWYYFLRRETGH